MNKREPLLSEEMARNIMKNCAYNPGTMNPVSETRAFYESLIDSGKLRVVEEVEFVDNDYDANVDCNRCGWSICYIHIEDNPMTFCPGCGNPIKR